MGNSLGKSGRVFRKEHSGQTISGVFASGLCGMLLVSAKVKLAVSGLS